MKNKINIKAVVCLVLALAMLLCSCGAKLDSSDEEKRTVMKAGAYNVPYEVYRYVKLNCQNDGITDAEELEMQVDRTVREIYSVFALALDYGIELEDEYVNALVDSAVNDAISESGSRSKYKKALAENYMNDSVFRLLTKRDLMRDEIYNAMFANGDISTDPDIMLNIATSDQFICVKQILVMGENVPDSQNDTVIRPEEKHTDEEAKAIAEKARERALAGEDFDALVNEYGESLYMFSNTDGYYLCRGMWETVNEAAAFSLSVGEISDVVKSSAGYSVFMRCEKSRSYIEANLDSISKNYYGAVLALKLEEKVAFMDVETVNGFDGSVDEMK